MRAAAVTLLLLTSAVAVAVASLLGCGRPAATPAVAAGAADASPTPEVGLEVLDTAGIRKLLESLRGKVVVLNVWASWCQPCAAEIPELDAFAVEQKDRGVLVLGVSIDDPAGRDRAVASFLAQKRPSYRNVMLARSEGAPFRALLDPRWDGGIPATFIFDREGTLQASLNGPRKREDLTQAVGSIAAGTGTGTGPRPSRP